MTDLPNGWVTTFFNEICTIVSGKNQKDVIDVKGEFPIVGSGGVMGRANQYLCEPESTVIGRKGTINRPFLIKTRFWNVDTAFGMSPHDNVNNYYFYYYCKKFNFSKLDKSTTIPSLAKSDLLGIEIPLPPLAEQGRIVAKIEELFSSLDKGIENLKTAQAQLKTYRQAVLKWAFEGRLTNENVPEGELPAGWKWVQVHDFLVKSKKGMTTGPFGTALNKKEHQKMGVPVLGIENIGEGLFVMPNKIFITEEKAKELQSFEVLAGDIIISRSGTVGEICSVPKQMEKSIISTNLIRVRLEPLLIQPKYFVFLFQGGSVRDQVSELCKGSTRAFLNQAILSSLNFPYCPLDEQARVVAEIEARLSVCDKVEESITQSLAQAEALRQSILKKAFEGKLVPQDPNDEPASELLARIHAAADSTAAAERVGKDTAKASSARKKAKVKRDGK